MNREMTRKILGVLLALTVLISCLPIIAGAEITESGECGAQGENITWTLDDNGTLTISGKGDMEDYKSYSRSIFYNKNNIKSVIIENGVTHIGNFTFCDCEGILNAKIPDSVNSIGNMAFYNCGGLTSITIPESVTSIGSGAFQKCSSLTNAAIPNGVISINDFVFADCGSLTSVAIPDSATSIEHDAFYNCSGLTGITIPKSVASIGSGAFQKCSGLTSIIIPENVTSIGAQAFAECSRLETVYYNAKSCERTDYPGGAIFADCYVLKLLHIGEGVEIIADGAFMGMKIESVAIPDGVKSVGNRAFSGCGLLSVVTIPKSVTKIGSHAFQSCGKLKTVEYDGSREDWDQIDIDIYNEPLLNAKINYNSAIIPTPQPTLSITPTPAPTEKPTSDLKRFTVSGSSVTNKADTEQTAAIIIAEYDGGKLTNVTTEKITFDANETKAFTIPQDGKIFVWNSLSGMQSLVK